jgi:hypothetical protein
LKIAGWLFLRDLRATLIGIAFYSKLPHPVKEFLNKNGVRNFLFSRRSFWLLLSAGVRT